MTGTALADRASVSHQAGWVKLYELMGRGWVESHDGLLAAVSGLPSASPNGVIVYGDSDPAELTDAVIRVKASRLPSTLQTRPLMAEAASELADRLALTPEASLPLMGITAAPSAPEIAGLEMRQLGSDEGEIHAAIIATAFDIPFMLMRRMCRPERLASPNVYFLVGEVNGVPVTTAMVDLNAGSGWIFGVATRPSHRRQGLGAAITAATAELAFEHGARAVFLLSSPMGADVYTKLGFRELEWWTSWSQPWDA